MPKSTNKQVTKHEKLRFREILLDLEENDFVSLKEIGDLYYKQNDNFYFAELKLHNNKLTGDKSLRALSQLYEDYKDNENKYPMLIINKEGLVLLRTNIKNRDDIISANVFLIAEKINERQKKNKKIYEIENLDLFKKMIDNIIIIFETCNSDTINIKQKEVLEKFMKMFKIDKITANDFFNNIDSHIDCKDVNKPYKMYGGRINGLLALHSEQNKIEKLKYEDFRYINKSTKLTEANFNDCIEEYLNIGLITNENDYLEVVEFIERRM